MSLRFSSKRQGTKARNLDKGSTGGGTIYVAKTKVLIFCDVTALLISALFSRMQERVSAPRSGGTGFAPGHRHTKVLKMILVTPHLAFRFLG